MNGRSAGDAAIFFSPRWVAGFAFGFHWMHLANPRMQTSISHIHTRARTHTFASWPSPIRASDSQNFRRARRSLAKLNGAQCEFCRRLYATRDMRQCDMRHIHCCCARARCAAICIIFGYSVVCVTFCRIEAKKHTKLRSVFFFQGVVLRLGECIRASEFGIFAQLFAKTSHIFNERYIRDRFESIVFVRAMPHREDLPASSVVNCKCLQKAIEFLPSHSIASHRVCGHN